ncbi:MAG: hypothetical protein JO042_16340 [Sinobacteraceae bacterium]|nr:hypothetical protein [Nevskiaceae bacterium]
MPLPVTDNQAPISSLSISAVAANASLVLAQGIFVQTNNGVPTLYVTPEEAATGQTVINVTVTDAMGGIAVKSFNLTVNAVDLSFTAFAQGVLAKGENDTPSQVNGFTLVQDADTSTAFNALFQ